MKTNATSLRTQRTLFLLLVFFFSVGCDQLSKIKVRQSLEYHQKINLVGNFFYLTKVENSGAMLSLGSKLPAFWRGMILTWLPLCALLLGLGYILRKPNRGFFPLTGYAFILGGGVGNLYDRLVFGSVTDFMNMGIGSLRTGIFNMADVSITTGLIILILNSALKKPVTNQTKNS